jgi:ATP-dependent DNA helicase RecG
MYNENMNLNSPLEKEFRINPAQKSALKKLGIVTVENLLYHFPSRYGDTSQIYNIRDIKTGENVVLFGKITGLKTSKAFIKKIPMSDGMLEDETGKIKLVWFNQPYIAKMIAEGSL